MWSPQLKVFHALLAGLLGRSAALQLSVGASGGNKTSSLQYGVFFEEIYFSGDGGIYAELVQNRAFQGSVGLDGIASPERTLTAYRPVGNVSLAVDDTNPLSSALPYGLRVDVPAKSFGQVGFLNEGFWGMHVTHDRYTASFYLKGDYDGPMKLSIRSDLTDEVFGSSTVHATQTARDGWKQYKTIITPSKAPDVNNTLAVTFEASRVAGKSLFFNLISLFPKTFKDRQNGLRPDLVEDLLALKPSYLRLGGSNLEGLYPPFYWKWNATIGPLEDRPGRPGVWSQTNTDGLGVIELFQWCEDMNVEPILSVWDGLYMSGNVTPESQIGAYVEEALNLLEFVLGPATSPYGSWRASLGYPEPFHLKYLEIGNEDNLFGGQASYEAYRYPAFHDAISAAYPDLKLFSSYLLPSQGDYHIYSRPDYLVSQFSQWDNWDRKYPFIIGEYAVIQHNDPNMVGVDWFAPQLDAQTMLSSAAEAVYLIGCERNADVCLGASWGALFKNFNFNNVSLALIKHTADPAETIYSYSYYVEKLLSTNRLTTTLPVAATLDDGSPAGTGGPIYHVAGYNDQTQQYIVKFANYNGTSTSITVTVPDNGGWNQSATLTKLSGPGPLAYNFFNNETSQLITETVPNGINGFGPFTLDTYEVAVLSIPALVSFKDGNI